MRLDLGMGLGAVPIAPGLFGVPWSKIALALGPDTIVASGTNDGDAVTGWRCATGLNPNATATSCVLDTNGPVNGVRFNGTSSHLDGNGPGGTGNLWSDDGVTIFLVAKTITEPPSGGRGCIFDTSDTGADARSSNEMTAFGSRVIRQEQVDSAVAQYVSAPTVATVFRARYTAYGRQVWENGTYGGSSVVYGGPARTVKHYRAGGRFGNFWYWNGVLYRVIAGVGLTLLEEEKIDAGLRAEISATEPFTWASSVGAASDNVGDPRFMMPSTREAIVGVPVQLMRDGVHYADGKRTQTFTSDLPIDDTLGDRWVMTPTTAGTYTARLTESTYSTTSSIVAVPAISNAATPINVFVFGDSQIARAGNIGWLIALKARLGSRINFLGPYQTSPGEKHCGIDSTTWAYWDSVSTVGFVDNPWANGGASIDLATFITNSLGGVTPDVIIASIQNDASNSTQVGIPTAFSAAMVHAESIITRWKAVAPAALFGLATIYPGATNPAAWSNSAATRLIYREKYHHWCELLCSYWAGREVDNIRLIHTFPSLDCIRSYPMIGVNVDGHHFGPDPGHADMADVIEPWLAHYAY